MAGYVVLRGHGPEVLLRVGPDATPFTVPIRGGGSAVMRLASTTPFEVLPVPFALTAPVITGGAQVGLTPTVTAATWSAVPTVPAGMTREVETRFTIASTPVSVPLAIGTLAGSVVAEQRARHVRAPDIGSWSAWVQSAPVTVTVRTLEVPLTTFNLTLPAPITSRFSLLATVDAEIIGTGTGNFTVAVTSPAPYIGGPYANDLSAEGGNALLNFEAIVTAPQSFFRPVIIRTTVAPGGAQIKVGDTFTITPGLWMIDAEDRPSVARTFQWRLDGSAISGATGLTFVATAPGVLSVVETVTGAGATRTAVSNTITVASVSRTLNVPLTTFDLTLPVPALGRDSLAAGDGAIVINALAPLGPDLTPVAGDTSITISGA